MTKDSDNVPQAMVAKFTSILSKTDAFAEQYLDAEYRQLLRRAVAMLCRKRPSPLLSGTEESWSAGIVHAIGTANFLFDKSQIPHCKAADLYRFFGVSASTAQSKSKVIRNLLKIDYFSFQWALPSKAEQNPMIWMVQVNGLIVDIRKLPREVQELAYEKGLIPFVPACKSA